MTARKSRYKNRGETSTNRVQEAQPVLRLFVAEGAKAKGKSEEEHVRLLEDFLSQPYVSEATTWKEIFSSAPPRSVVASLLRLLGKPDRLHRTMQRWSYRSRKEFRIEGRRILRWWSKSRRQRATFRKRILRDGQKAYWTRATLAVNSKVRAHFKRMVKKLRVEGFFAWQTAAQATLQAGVPVQSGTIPVERYWSCLLTYLPTSSQFISLQWYQVLCGLAFVKYNFQHFAGDSLTGSVERDAEMEAKISTATMLARALHESEEHLRATHLDPLFDPFRD